MALTNSQDRLIQVNDNHVVVPVDENIIHAVIQMTDALGFSSQVVTALAYQIQTIVSGQYIDIQTGRSYISDRLCQAVLPHVSVKQFLCDLPALVCRVCHVLQSTGLPHVTADLNLLYGECSVVSVEPAVLQCYPHFLGEVDPAITKVIQRCCQDVFILAMQHRLPSMLCYCLSWHCGFCLVSRASSNRGAPVGFVNILNAVMRFYRSHLGMDRSGLTVRYHLFRYSLGRLFRKRAYQGLLSGKEQRLFCACAAPTRSWWGSRMQHANDLDHAFEVRR